MGRQINFFMMPEDVAELDAQIKKLELVIVADCVETNAVKTLQSVKESENAMYLALPEELALVNLFYANEKFLYRVHPMESPVIEYRPSRLIMPQEELIAGRLYYDSEYFDKQNQYVTKNEKLTQRANKLFTWYKNKYKIHKIGDYYIGSVAYHLAMDNQIVIQQLTRNLKVA